MESVADIIRERAIRLFAKAAAAREQGHIEHALKLANLASGILNEAAAAEATAASIATQQGNGWRSRSSATADQ
jgi:hypothetical protein